MTNVEHIILFLFSKFTHSYFPNLIIAGSHSWTWNSPAVRPYIAVPRKFFERTLGDTALI